MKTIAVVCSFSMIRQVVFLGYSLWVVDDPEQTSLRPRKPLYHPVAIAAYCMLATLFVGVILYGINVSRRGYPWKGRLFVTLSSILLILWLLFPTVDFVVPIHPSSILNLIVAVNLYAIEKPYFTWAMCRGGSQAKSLVPLAWVLWIWTTVVLFHGLVLLMQS